MLACVGFMRTFVRRTSLFFMLLHSKTVFGAARRRCNYDASADEIVEKKNLKGAG